jgi:putative membrane-bound dehydrogenase-like protein
MRACLVALGAVVAFAFSLALAQPKPQPPNPKDVHDPANAVFYLDIHKDLAATLFTSEPAITNPTNMDIDARGRVWICDVVNYRGHNGRRPEGDRIMILEATDGAGTPGAPASKVKTFYQGRDVDSALGICVLGDKVIVSCAPNILVFTFDPATDKILKKEYLFTKTGSPQNDHSAHTFVFGPDGKLYWNFGNAGGSVNDKNGKPVIDRAGNTVAAHRNPYCQGMVFRCNTDGSDFETLGWNFRNNYEVTVDSFGTLWQSDNDDDGNRGVRINYVMEFGNYGYTDEFTGAGWQAKRTNMETEIPLRHWHLNDPGVVPNLLQTGQGSPCGICVYEGNLLPKVFHNQIIHCDAGPSVCRAYPVVNDGAGYKAEIVNILDGKRNNWFRPVDPCVAPDGSLFVTDWYDPGVGGHAQADHDRGRVFRVAPPGVKYTVPKFDFTTAEGCAEALKNPCLSVRYEAWTALHKLQDKAEPALLKLWKDENPRIRARALWLLGKIDGKGQHYVDLALKDANPDIRITGLRLARQLKDFDVASAVQKVVRDPSPQVRRDCALALRHNKAARAAELWTELANQHDGKDRWYLESLGIGADRQWDAFFSTWLNSVGDKWNTPTGRDIVWRSRSPRTCEYLAKIITDPATPVAELPRYFRAFDFQKAENKDEILSRLAFSNGGDGARRDLITAESITRLKGFDLKKNPEYAAAVDKLLDARRGTPLFLELVDKFSVAARYPDVLAMAQKDAEGQVGVNAVKVLLDKNQKPLLQTALADKNAEMALNTAKVLGTSGDARGADLLLAIVKDDKASTELRRQAVRSAARSQNGAKEILKLAQDKKLPAELKDAAALSLHQAQWKDVKQAATTLFPLPPPKGGPTLPPLTELVRRKGDVRRGEGVFAKAGTCANCHIVNGAGKEVGPDLSEIGKKLSREAIYESILYPSASIALSYESWVLETKNGTTLTGLMVSQTPDEVTLKAADGIVRTFKKKDVDTLVKSPLSLMPADVYKDMTVQDLADVVEYLLSLKEAKKPKK